MSFNFSEIENNEDKNVEQILQDIGIESTYFDNIMTQGAVSTEYTASKEEYFKLPEPQKKTNINGIKETSKKKKPILSFILMLITLNDLTDLDTWENIQAFTWSVLLVACTSGCLKSDKKFEIVEYKCENEDFSGNANKIKKVLDYIPVAKNFVALSVINFIRFNHHFPSEKIDLIKKSLIGIPENEINEFLESNSKNLKLFYQYPFQAAKLVNEWAYFYININNNLKIDNEDKSDIELLNYGIIRNYTSSDQIITIRNEPTTNCFLILDLVYVFLNYLDTREILGLLPQPKIFQKLMQIRKYLKTHPFTYHPARFYLNIQFNKDDYNSTVATFQENIKKIGNLIFLFCAEEGGSLAEAKSVLKFQNDSLGEFKNIYEIYKLTKENKSFISNEQKENLKKILSPDIKIPNNKEELIQKNTEMKKIIFEEEE